LNNSQEIRYKMREVQWKPAWTYWSRRRNRRRRSCLGFVI